MQPEIPAILTHRDAVFMVTPDEIANILRQRIRESGATQQRLGTELGYSSSWTGQQLLGRPAETLRELIIKAPDKAQLLAKTLLFKDVQSMALQFQLFEGTGMFTSARNDFVSGYSTSKAAATQQPRDVGYEWFSDITSDYAQESLASVYVDEATLIADNAHMTSGMWALISTAPLNENSLLEGDVGLYYVPTLEQAVWRVIPRAGGNEQRNHEASGTLLRARNPLRAVLLTHEHSDFVGLRVAMTSTRNSGINQ